MPVAVAAAAAATALLAAKLTAGVPVRGAALVLALADGAAEADPAGADEATAEEDGGLSVGKENLGTGAGGGASGGPAAAAACKPPVAVAAAVGAVAPVGAATKEGATEPPPPAMAAARSGEDDAIDMNDPALRTRTNEETDRHKCTRKRRGKATERER